MSKLASGDKAATDELDTFRKDVATFVRFYDFMSQIVDYGDAGLEKRSIFLRLPERLIRPENFTAGIDLSVVTLVKIKQSDKAAPTSPSAFAPAWRGRHRPGRAPRGTRGWSPSSR